MDNYIGFVDCFLSKDIWVVEGNVYKIDRFYFFNGFVEVDIRNGVFGVWCLVDGVVELFFCGLFCVCIFG